MPYNYYAPAYREGITAEEVKLARLINEYRAENRLPFIPGSRALSIVANRHVRDLAENVGSLTHAWSDVPYDSDDRSTWHNMWEAPQRLRTGYPGEGYENAYQISKGWPAIAEDILNCWKGSPGHNSLIINQGIWRGKEWKALGVGIYKNYAVMWVGKEIDPTGEPMLLF